MDAVRVRWSIAAACPTNVRSQWFRRCSSHADFIASACRPLASGLRGYLGAVVGSTPVAPGESVAPVVRLRDVSKTYGTGAGKTQVLRGVTFDIERGAFVALVGHSGSGKSTLLNIIGGLDEPDSGDVEVVGVDTRRAGDRRRSRLRNQSIGFVFQAFNLLDHLTVLGNVTLPAAFANQKTSDHAARGREVLRKVGMVDLAHRYPGELSGGQKQRVAIARALFQSPTLLLCDEPTGNLDSDTGREVIEFFRELNRADGVTLIIVTHERRVSNAATRVIGIRDGRVVETTDEALAEASGSGADR